MKDRFLSQVTYRSNLFGCPQKTKLSLDAIDIVVLLLDLPFDGMHTRQPAVEEREACSLSSGSCISPPLSTSSKDDNVRQLSEPPTQCCTLLAAHNVANSQMQSCICWKKLIMILDNRNTGVPFTLFNVCYCQYFGNCFVRLLYLVFIFRMILQMNIHNYPFFR